MDFISVSINLKACVYNCSGENTLPIDSDEEYLMYETCEDLDIIAERIIDRLRDRSKNQPWFTNEQWSELTEDVVRSLK